MARYAYFDSAAPAPSRVLGWIDTEVLDYPELPPAADRKVMTAGQWEARMDGAWAVEDGRLVRYTAPLPPPMPHEVPKLLVVERIAAAGKLRAARAALKLGVPDAQLSDAELLLRDRWDAARVLASDDAAVRGLLSALGMDADAVLAPA